MTQEIIVVGAGVVGITSALLLQRAGMAVRVLDRAAPCAEASQGNAGAFAFPEIIPLATPGIMRRAPKWLLDPLGPLSIPPRYAVQIAPWMMRFWRASWADRYAQSVAAQAALMAHGRGAFERLVMESKAEHLIQRDGQLMLYESAAELHAAMAQWDVRRDHGIRFDILHNKDAIAAHQPGLGAQFTHAVFTPDWMNTVDPKAYTLHLFDRFCAEGGAFERADVRALRTMDDGVRLETDTVAIHGARAVVAAGAWSHHLARGLGDRIPLETERGYNTTLPAGAFDLRMHLTFGQHGFVASKINGGVRIGGAVELGGLALPPNYKRAETLLKKAEAFLPGLRREGGTQWMGFRPSLPDSLPVIGASPRADRVIYAFGHGHLGLTQSAGTAELVRDMILARPSAMDLAPFAPDRF